MATHSSILSWKIPYTEEAGGLQSMGVAESDTTEQLTLSLHFQAKGTNITATSPGKKYRLYKIGLVKSLN